MYRSNLAIFPSTLIVAAALLGGCALEQSGEPGEPGTQAIELLEVEEEGGACFITDDAGTVECFQTEAEADAQLLASLPADEDPALDGLAAVPSCVSTSLNDSGWTDYLRVSNNCSYSVRVKVRLAFKTDFPCYTINAYQARNYSWGYPGRFDGLVSC